MMRSRCSGLVWLAVGSACSALLACDDDADVVRNTDTSSASEPAAPSERDASGNAGAGGRSGRQSTAFMPTCVASECPSVMALGSLVPGCCQNDGTCGGLVEVMGAPLCAPPNVDNLVAVANPTLMQLSPEAVLSDPACSSRTIFGTQLPGCCDQTGVCGVSTAPVASGSPGAIRGLDLPLTCVSPAEAARLGGGMAALGAAEPQPCGGAGAPDAAAPALPEPAPDGGAGEAG